MLERKYLRKGVRGAFDFHTRVSLSHPRKNAILKQYLFKELLVLQVGSLLNPRTAKPQ